MFGHHDDQSEPQDNQDKDASHDDDAKEQPAPDSENDQHDQQPDKEAEQPAEGSSMNGVDELVVKPEDDNASDDKAAEDDKPETPADGEWQHPGAPLEEDKERIRDVISPAGGFPQHPSDQYPNAGPGSSSQSDDANKELIDIRKKALDDLEPLIDKLDLPPEDKFRTIMMMIQSNDDEEMVKAAYEAAHSIEDEKVRAQALFDIVNEINYFTNPPAAPTDNE